MSHDEHGFAHVMSIKMLLGVWIALMALTGITVWSATSLELGALDLPVAMGIATVKALLVALFFMHLKYDRPFNGMIFLASVIFAGVFVTISMMDTGQNQVAIEDLRTATGTTADG